MNNDKRKSFPFSWTHDLFYAFNIHVINLSYRFLVSIINVEWVAFVRRYGVCGVCIVTVSNWQRCSVGIDFSMCEWLISWCWRPINNKWQMTWKNIIIIVWDTKFYVSIWRLQLNQCLDLVDVIEQITNNLQMHHHMISYYSNWLWLSTWSLVDTS